MINNNDFFFFNFNETDTAVPNCNLFTKIKISPFNNISQTIMGVRRGWKKNRNEKLNDTFVHRKLHIFLPY